MPACLTATASAPAKLVLSGEYAVLYGTPALSMAVNVRARAQISRRSDDRLALDSRAGDTWCATGRGRPHPEGGLSARWEASDGPLQLVDAVLRWRIIDALQWKATGLDIALDTQAFFRDGMKLGLGSSAALTVAMAGALAALAGHALIEPAARDRLLGELLALHREFQGGVGSGVDIATAVHGGVISYRLTDGTPVVRSGALPGDLHMLGVWTGQSASTSRFLRQLEGWRERDAAGFAALFAELDRRGRAVETAWSAESAQGLAEALAEYADGLVMLGDASGLDNFSPPHRALAALAEQAGVVYKPCGAGGGDVGLGFSTDREALSRFGQLLPEAGFAALDMRVDPNGIEVGSRLE